MPEQASSERPPALLECVAAIAASPNLAPVLANRPSTPAVLYCQSTPDWIRAGLGAQLLGQTLRVLSLPTCSPASLDLALRVIESILSLGTHVTEGNPDEGEIVGTRNDVVESGTFVFGEGPREGSGETLSQALLGPHKTALLLCLRDLATGSRGGTPAGAQGEKKSKETVRSVACPSGMRFFCSLPS